MTHEEIISLWPNIEALAEDVGTNVRTIYKWRERNSIPFGWGLKIVDAGRKRGIELTCREFMSAVRGNGGKEDE